LTFRSGLNLTYLEVEERDISLQMIAESLERIKYSIEKVAPAVRVEHKRGISKLLISAFRAQIKLEVNQTNRGAFAPTNKMTLCNRAQEKFDTFCAIQVVSLGQLYGGKICAALDRQHPRDLFDVKFLLENEGLSDEVKIGFLFCLLSSNRPINELLSPNLKDQRLAMENQFDGMSSEVFTYEEYEIGRAELIDVINKSLTEVDKAFLLNFQNLTPDWTVYDFERFPAIQWKLKNLQYLKNSNPEKYLSQYDALKNLLT